MARLVTLGEPLVGLVAADYGPLAEIATFRRHVVGAELNVAIGVARLGHVSTFIGRVGDDGFGAAIVRRLRAESVDASRVVVDGTAPTGLLFRERRALGPAEVIYHRRGSAGSGLRPEDVDAAAEQIASADWLHLTGITPALSPGARAAMARALELGRRGGAERRPTISLDLNLRRKLWSDAEASSVLRPLVGRVDVVFAGAEEAAVIAGRRPADRDTDPGALGRALLGLGAREVIVTLGVGGAVAVREDEATVHRQALRLDHVVDPVGAGDAFCAGFIAARLDGRGTDAALAWGVACGAAVAATEGDTAGLPTRPELERLLAVGPEALR